MTPLNLIQEIENAGGKIETDGGKIKIKAPIGCVSDTLKKQLVEYKAEIIELLKVNFSIERSNQKQNRAQGYGCAKCGCKSYRQVVNGWECEGCRTVFTLIGGTRGPVIIQ